MWDDFETEAKSDKQKGGPQCGVCALLASLPKSGRDAVDVAFENRGLTSTAIRRTLARRLNLGPDEIPSPYTFNRHRRGECK